jgi:hypothetical protein
VTSTDSKAELYSAYVELTTETNSGERKRMQWVIFPPLPPRLAPGDSPTSDHLCYFTREQDRANHRAVWRYVVDTQDSFKDQLARTMRIYQDAGWTPSEVITCEVHPTELADIIKSPKTPYRILQRLQKVARALYKIDIS